MGAAPFYEEDIVVHFSKSQHEYMDAVARDEDQLRSFVREGFEWLKRHTRQQIAGVSETPVGEAMLAVLRGRGIR